MRWDSSSAAEALGPRVVPAVARQLQLGVVFSLDENSTSAFCILEEMVKLTSLEQALVEELRDLYSAERQLVKALPKMAKAASAAKLRQGFEKHLQQTRKHVERLEQACTALGTSPGGKTCAAMEGLIKEGDELLSENADAAIKDALLIAAAQKVEHYEIASYGSACAWAERLGHRKTLRLLNQTLTEEKQTDEKLTKLAESSINAKAAAAPPPDDTTSEGLTEQLSAAAGKAREMMEGAMDSARAGMKAAGKIAKKVRRRML